MRHLRSGMPISSEVIQIWSVSDIDTAVVDGLKALDPNRPIREADMLCVQLHPPEILEPGR
jgi:hypothetical protein